jgi:hypothetical protein
VSPVDREAVKEGAEFVAVCLGLAAVGKAGLWGYRRVRARRESAAPAPRVQPAMPRVAGASPAELAHINDALAWDLFRIVVPQTAPGAVLEDPRVPPAATAFAIRNAAYIAHNRLVAVEGEPATLALLPSDQDTTARIAQFGGELFDRLSLLLRHDAEEIWHSLPPDVQLQHWLGPLRGAAQVPRRRPVGQGQGQAPGLRPTIGNPHIGQPPMQQEYDLMAREWILEPAPLMPLHPATTWPL